MPELPEVETVRRGLASYLPSRRIVAVEVHHPRAVRRHPAGPGDLVDRLLGRSVTGLHRRGKYLWACLDDGAALVAHLGMSGQLLLPESGTPADEHLRVRIGLADSDRTLDFVDQRTFGHLAVDELVAGTDGAVVPALLAHIAADPFEPSFDERAVARAMRARRSSVKRALLDQTLVSGIGNIYADESLWRSRLHHDYPTSRLTATRARGLLDDVRGVLAAATDAGGTSFDSLYVNVNGESGWFSVDLNVYGREGRPCPRCGRPIVREKFMNRSSYTCPRCQRRARRVRSQP
jgi:formamidopyrimidine-DNA glycosylase